MSEKAMLRIRFNLNQRKGTAENTRSFQRAGQQFAAAIVRQVGLRAADDMYRNLVGKIRAEIANDVRQEIQNIAMLYTQWVVGRSGQRDNLITLRAQTTATEAAAKFGTWKPLSNDTIRRKGHASFFEDRGNFRTQMNKASVWEKSFGPISVKVHRTKGNVEHINPETLYKDAGGHFSVARVSVFALGKITPAMLPELATGKSAYHDYSGGRAAGLVDLVDAGDAKLKIGNWGRNRMGAYRPTLEPFLGFVLTRAIPAAVARRIIPKGTENHISGGRRGILEYPGGSRRLR